MRANASKFGRLLMVLALALSFSLVPVAVMGQGSSTYAGYKLGTDITNSTSTWSTEQEVSGNYSAKLLHTTDAAGSVYVEFVPQTGITVDDLADITADPEWSFNYFMEDGKTWGPQLELQFTSAGYATTGDGLVDITVMLAQGVITTDEWVTADVLASSPACYYGNDPTDGTEFSSFDAPAEAPWMYDLDAILAAIDAEAVMVADSDSAAAWQLTRVRLELWENHEARSCYIDDVTIGGTTYDLEPMVLDAEYYKTGDTVNVTVYNGNASGTIVVLAQSDTAGPITLALNETAPGTGEFTESFLLVDTTPGVGELLVNDADSVDVQYAGDWGAGTQTLVDDDPPSATVDDTAPVVSITTPSDGDDVKGTVTIDTSVTEIRPYSAQIKIDGTAVLTTTTAAPEYSWDTTAATDGSHTIVGTATDDAGNVGSDSIDVTVDNTDPVITGQVATPGVVESDVVNTIVFTANVADATSGVDTVTINVSGIDGSTALAMLDDGVASDETADDDIYTAVITITIDTEDDYLLPVTATDEAGNDDTANITLGVWDDTVAPTISNPEITYPFGLDSARPGDTITITATVTDVVGVESVVATCSVFAPATMSAASDVYTGTATVTSTVSAGSYTVTITAEDLANTATDTSLVLEVVPQFTGHDIALYEGWNLVSLPLIPEDSDIATVLAATDEVESVQHYTGGPAGSWQVYAPPVESLGTMEDGKGYWMDMSAAETLTVYGYEEVGPPPAVPPSYDVVEGWNMIGFKSTEAIAKATYLGDVASDLEAIYGYNAEVGTYFIPGTNLEPGHGYWAGFSAPGTIYP